MIERGILNSTVAEIAQSPDGLDRDAFKEIYWNPTEDCCPVAIVVGRGEEAVAMMREAMQMLREENSANSTVEIVTDGIPRPGRFSGNPDVPHHNMEHQRNVDLDIMLAALSDIARTYPDSPEEQLALRVAHSTCAAPEEMLTRLLQAILLLISTNEQVELKNIGRFLSQRRRVAWILKQLSQEVVP